MIGPVFVHTKKWNNLDFDLVFDKFMWDKIRISFFCEYENVTFLFLWILSVLILVYLVDSEMSLKVQLNISERTDVNCSKKFNHCLQVNRNLRVFVHAKKWNNLDFDLVFDKFMWDKIIISFFLCEYEIDTFLFLWILSVLILGVFSW